MLRWWSHIHIIFSYCRLRLGFLIIIDDLAADSFIVGLLLFWLIFIS